jgi:hypothetical protein
MKRFASLVLVAMAINWVILVASIRFFHDDRSIFRSVRVGSELSLDTFQSLRGSGECRFLSDGKNTVCYFGDFWHHYTIVIDQHGIVTSKLRMPVADLVFPESFLHSRQRLWLYEAAALLLAAAVIGSMWFGYSGRPKT